MFSKAYSTLMEIKVVRVPAPAISGKAKGTMEAVLGSSSLNKVRPRIISRARKKSTKAPATAKELISTPNRFKILSPKKRNIIMIIADAMVALPLSICPTFCLKLMIIGILPVMSITANRIIVAERISLKSKFILSTKGRENSTIVLLRGYALVDNYLNKRNKTSLIIKDSCLRLINFAFYDCH